MYRYHWKVIFFIIFSLSLLELVREFYFCDYKNTHYYKQKVVRPNTAKYN